MEWERVNFVRFSASPVIRTQFGCSARYLLARILDEIGIHDNRSKNLINLALTCWGLVNATILALTVTKFKRRTMYLVRAFQMFLCSTFNHTSSDVHDIPIPHLHWLDSRQRTIRPDGKQTRVEGRSCVS